MHFPHFHTNNKHIALQGKTFASDCSTYAAWPTLSVCLLEDKTKTDLSPHSKYDVGGGVLVSGSEGVFTPVLPGVLNRGENMVHKVFKYNNLGS